MADIPIPPIPPRRAPLIDIMRELEARPRQRQSQEFDPVAAMAAERRVASRQPLPLPPIPPAVAPPRTAGDSAEAGPPRDLSSVSPTIRSRLPENNPYVSAAIDIAEKYNLPRDVFLSLVHQESRFDPKAKSPRGAFGLTQLMPGTARDLGVDPRDPMANLDAGARYLRQQIDRFGSLPLALAAYNSGPGRVIKSGNQIPNIRETQNYVSDILRNAGMEGAATDQRYGFAEGGRVGRVARAIRRAVTRETPEPTPNLPPVENSRLTQVATTGGTYEKARDVLRERGVEGPVLDYGAGRGHGSAILGGDSFEPYPSANFRPTYTDPSEIPADRYAGLVNLNVLNVLPPNIRDEAVREMGRVLEPQGTAVITTRGRDVMDARGTPGPEPMSLVIGEGDRARYQKGFTPAELREYLQRILGPRFDVEGLDLGAAGALVRRLYGLAPAALLLPENESDRGLEDLDRKYAEGGEVMSDEDYDSRLLSRMKAQMGRASEPTRAEQMQALRTAGRSAAEGLADVLLPQSPLDVALMVALGPGGRAARLAGSAALASLEPSEAEASRLRRLIRAYHGSPHAFERFDISKIGTGEGNQAYGRGLYFAEAEPVAFSYRGNPEARYARLSGHMSPREEFAFDMAVKPNIRDWDIIESLVKRYGDTISFDEANELAKNAMSNRGHMYEVRLRTAPEEMVNWNAPLVQQPERAIPFLEDVLRAPRTGSARVLEREMKPIGEAVDLRGPEVAAQLREAGIPGLRYLDAGSRSGGRGTSNYVMFGDDLIDITRRYAQGGLAELDQKYADGGRVRRPAAAPVASPFDADYIERLAAQAVGAGEPVTEVRSSEGRGFAPMPRSFGEAGQRMSAVIRGEVEPTPEEERQMNVVRGFTEGPASIRAYHGSPYRFDQFDFSKIGTGEGAQRYGHGLYFADLEKTAQKFRPQGGYMYEANINARPEDLLNYHSTLAETSPEILRAIEKYSPQTMDYWRSVQGKAGDSAGFIARIMAEDIGKGFRRGAPEVSRLFASEGIPGARYIDPATLGTADKGYNYVVFDPGLIEMVRRYAEGGTVRAPTFDVREPYESELAFFEKNPNVSGMATEDNKVILNPNSNLSKDERDAVILNERARLAIRNKLVSPPDFDLTPEQSEAFSQINNGRPYGNMRQMRETIAARILSGDPSALNPTADQMHYAQQLREALKGYAEGGTVRAPKETTIAGQDHKLAYITDREAALLKARGGSGRMTDYGVRAYDEGPGGEGPGGDPSDNAGSMSESATQDAAGGNAGQGAGPTGAGAGPTGEQGPGPTGEDTGGEETSVTAPTTAPTPNTGAFGQFGTSLGFGVVGGLAGLGLGVPGLGTIGSAIGAAIDAGRANEQLGMMGLSPTVDRDTAALNAVSMGAFGQSVANQFGQALGFDALAEAPMSAFSTPDPLGDIAASQMDSGGSQYEQTEYGTPGLSNIATSMAPATAAPLVDWNQIQREASAMNMSVSDYLAMKWRSPAAMARGGMASLEQMHVKYAEGGPVVSVYDPDEINDLANQILEGAYV